MLTVGGVEYEVLRCSDAVRGGMSLEVWDRQSDEMIAEAFLSDSDCLLVFSAFRRNIPFEIVEYLTTHARAALTPVR